MIILRPRGCLLTSKQARLKHLLLSKFVHSVQSTRELLEIADVFKEHGAARVSLGENIDLCHPGSECTLCKMRRLIKFGCGRSHWLWPFPTWWKYSRHKKTGKAGIAIEQYLSWIRNVSSFSYSPHSPWKSQIPTKELFIKTKIHFSHSFGTRVTSRQPFGSTFHFKKTKESFIISIVHRNLTYALTWNTLLKDDNDCYFRWD